MKVHLLATESDAASGAVADDLMLLSRLVQARVLRKYSEVWLNSGSTEPVLWALDASSRLIYIHQSRITGAIRLTPDRLRWAPEQGADAIIDIKATELTGSRAARVTFVILGSRDGKPLRVVNAHNNTVIKPRPGNRWTHERWNIVNVAESTVGEWKGEAGTREAAEALTLGTELLLRGVPVDEVVSAAAALSEIVLEVTDTDLDLFHAARQFADASAVKVRGRVEAQMAEARAKGLVSVS